MWCTETGHHGNYVKHNIDKTSEKPLYRLFRKKGESVQSLVSG